MLDVHWVGDETGVGQSEASTRRTEKPAAGADGKGATNQAECASASPAGRRRSPRLDASSAPGTRSRESSSRQIGSLLQQTILGMCYGAPATSCGVQGARASPRSDCTSWRPSARAGRVTPTDCAGKSVGFCFAMTTASCSCN